MGSPLPEPEGMSCGLSVIATLSALDVVAAELWRPRGFASSAKPTARFRCIWDNSSLFGTTQLAFQVVEHRLNALDFLQKCAVSCLSFRDRFLPRKQLTFKCNTGYPLG